MNKKISKVNKNCWRVAQASRVKMLIDGEAYFAALRAAITRAS
jgi:hypothetical protein